MNTVTSKVTTKGQIVIPKKIREKYGIYPSTSIVITSYSIHYTKLYDDRELAAGFLLTERIIRERRQLVDIAACHASVEPQNTLDVFLAPGVDRITSYNVCYTKLLREYLESMAYLSA